MSRRSSRLLSGGYYHSDEESDSSSVTTISYRENPVKVFKKKSGGRKKRSDGESPASSRASPEASPSDWTAASRLALRSPAPPSPLTSPSVPPSPSTPEPTWTRPVLHFKPQSEPVQSGVDSSGYSSSEDPLRRPAGSAAVNSAEARTPSREWLHQSVSRLKDAVSGAVSGAVAGVRSSRVVQLARSSPTLTQAARVTADPGSRSRMKKLCLLLLLLLILLGGWWTSKLSGLSFRTKPSLIVPAHSLSGSQASALDAAAISAAVEEQVQIIQREMKLKHELLLAELKQQVQTDLQLLRTQSREKEEQEKRERRQKETEEEEKEREKERKERERETKEREREQREREREQKQSELASGLQQLQVHSDSAADRLVLRLAALEEQLTQMEQKEDLGPSPTPSPSLTPELEQALEAWLSRRLEDQTVAQPGTSGTCGTCDSCGRPLADKMADFALESQGASVVSTRCSETYRTRSACVSLFGLPLWYPSESPRTVIQGPAVLLPGKCWAFHGVQGTLVIALSHPIRISHVSLDHLPRHSSPTGRIDSAPKDFQVYGMANETEEGTLLGTFMYKEDGEPTQTFSLSGLTDAVYHVVELRVLSNWGHVQYTCVYRFRVHGQLAST